MREYALWIYGLFATMIGGSFLFMDKKKQDKAVCKVLHESFDKQLDKIDKKLDQLIDIHLNGVKRDD